MTHRTWPAVPAAALLLAALAVSPAQAAPAAAATVHPAAVDRADQDRVARYWTPDRMRGAVAMDQLITRRADTPAAEVRTGAPVELAATAAPATTLSIPNTGSPWTGGGAVVQTAGRVFFTTGGRNASCSGNAVTSTNRSVVITAGHCVKYQGSWHTNWAFVPAYAAGAAPFGTWTARATLSTPQWTASEDINYDIGAAVVNQLDGRSLTDVVGAQGIAFNQPRRQPMYSFGYPAAAPYDGSRLIYCSGTAIDDFLLSRDHGLNCTMTGGASGGPWFVRFNEATGTGLVNSVNSFKYVFLPHMFGPYFGTDAQNLHATAQTR